MGIWLIVVPISAKLLTNDYFSKYDLSLPFTWYCFFFSALCFSIGNVLFSIYCPDIIKDNGSLEDFDREGKVSLHIKAYANDISFNYDNIKYSGSENSQTRIQCTFWPVFEAAKTSRNFSRWICSIFYYFGFVLALYVIGENTFWVIKYIFFNRPCDL